MSTSTNTTVTTPTSRDFAERLQYLHPNGDVIHFNNFKLKSRLGHAAVYYRFNGGAWVYSCLTSDPVATVKAWEDAAANGLTGAAGLPEFAFMELTARPVVSA
jgi:hypothetical protein